MSSNPAPKIRKFIPVEQSRIPEPDGFRFSLVSYNILAQVHVKSDMFPHSPPSCLIWENRSQAILTILKNLNTDFLCLQEVDAYESFYKGNMERLGYSSIYVKRERKKHDGCGIFYKPTSAELLLNEKIDYNDLFNNLWTAADRDRKLKKGTEPQNDPLIRMKHGLRRDCVGILALFKLRNPSCHHLIVANTHIYWDPEWADVKMKQVKYLLDRLARFKTQVSKTYGCTPSVIVAGDLNSMPGSPVYEYLHSGSSTDPQPGIHEDLPIPLNSFYAYTKGEPHFTNHTPAFSETIDYILFSSSDDIIKPVSYLDLPGPKSPDVTGGLPNNYHPSDHLPIGAEFQVLNA